MTSSSPFPGDAAPYKPAPRCPKCRDTRLKERLLSDHTTQMDVCPQCRGGWFDGEELAAVLSCALHELDIPEDAERTSCVCPKCYVPLARFNYPETDVEVDVCDQCAGIWLDRGEFKAINRQRAAHQDPLKFEEQQPTPQNLREAVILFVERIAIRYGNL